MRPILIIILVAAAATAAVAFMMDWEASTPGETTGTENAPPQTQKDTGAPGGEQPPTDGQKALGDPTKRGGRTADKREPPTRSRSEPAPAPPGTSPRPSGTGKTEEKQPAKFRAPQEVPAVPPGQTGQKDGHPKKSPARKDNPEKELRANNPDQIHLPPILSGVRFGTSPDPIEDHYEVAWHRQTRDELMLVHYPKGSEKAQIRFHFGREIGLKRIEMRFKESSKKGAVGLYNEIQQTYGRKYGALPESGSSRWEDERLKVRLKRRSDTIILTFQPA